MDDQPKMILIAGNMAAGKSTVAQALAERLPRSVHVRGDVFRRMIVNGQATMSFELSEEASSQLQLRYRIAANVAKSYLEAGFSVVYQDVIVGSELLDVVRLYQDVLLYVVVLCPNAEVVASREAGRDKRGYADKAMIHAFDRVLREQTPRLGYWLDTSYLTVAESVDAILAHLPEARIVQSRGHE